MTEIPRLSPSIAHKLTTESPLSAWAAHRLLGNFGEASTDAQLEGRLHHAAILMDHAGIDVVDADSFRTKAAREAKAEILAAGNTPVLIEKWDNIQLSAAAIRGQLERYEIVLDGKSEQRFEWDEETESGASVNCSGYIDHYLGNRIIDLKTSKTATTTHQATQKIATGSALLQDAAYRSALIAGEYLGRIASSEVIEVVFAFVQTVEPFAVTPVTLAGDFRELSHLRWRRAIETWHQCLSNGLGREFWPGPVDAITAVSPPGWMVSQEIEWEAMRDE